GAAGHPQGPAWAVVRRRDRGRTARSGSRCRDRRRGSRRRTVGRNTTTMRARRSMTRKTARERERGAAAVEFALVLPVLLMLIFGIIDFGRMLAAKIVITEAAREGARAT